MCRLARAAVVALLVASPSLAEDWAGKLVMFKDDEKTLGRKIGEGLVQDGKKLVVNGVYKVKSDDGKYVELVGQTGLLFRSDVMPVADAVAFFSGKIQAEPTKGKWFGRRGLARTNDGWNVTALIAGGKANPTLEAALADFSEAVRLEPAIDLWWSQRGTCHFQRGEYDAAIADYTEVIRLKPNAFGAYSTRGIAWRAKKEFDKALADYSKAIELNPKSAVTFNNRALVWVDKKEYDKAIADYTEAVTIDPKYALGFNNRGDAHKKARNWENAVADFKKAIELDPKYANAFVNLAWLKATCPEAKVRDGKAAVEWAKKGVELTPTSFAHNTLAAAYAETGQFDEAEKEIQKDLSDTSLSAATRTAYQTRLELYQKKEPYHEK